MIFHSLFSPGISSLIGLYKTVFLKSTKKKKYFLIKFFPFCILKSKMDNFPTAQERTKKKDRIKKLGRPPSYSTAEELQNKIEKYFNGGAMKRYVVTDSGATIGVPCPTISDLVLFLGFCDRRSFYAYEALPDFSYTIKKAR
ncbi:MAG: hypothetical protein AAB815_01205, partial [Patescibacteria group bacterium]